MAKIGFSTADLPVKTSCICFAPTKNNCVDYIQRGGPEWQETFAECEGYEYNRVVYVKAMNLIPLTQYEGQQIVCTFLPFFHAAVICLNDDRPTRILCIKHTATLAWLRHALSPTLPDGVVEETINVQKPPQQEPVKFDRMLGQIYCYLDFRIAMQQQWESETAWQQAQKYLATARGFDTMQKGMQTDFSSAIVYRLRSPEVRIDIWYQAFMIDVRTRTIYLTQEDVYE